MATPLIMLSLLVGPYLLGRVTGRRSADGLGRAGLALVFLFTGIGHFLAPEQLALMLPEWAPQRMALVYASGVMEIAVGIAAILPQTRVLAGWLIIAMMVFFVPVNIYAAAVRAPVGGHAWGPAYLLIRIPLQALIAWWSYRFAVGGGASARAVARS